MSLDLLLDLDVDPGDLLGAEAPTAGDASLHSAPAQVKLTLPSAKEINSHEDIAAFFDKQLAEELEVPRHELEWEDESDVDMVLRGSGRASATPSVPSPMGTPVATAPYPVDAVSGAEAPLGISSNAESLCNFREELIGGGASDDEPAARYEELLPGLYFVGIHRVEVLPGWRACLIAVRPDIAASTILDLVEQVLMSFGGAVAHYTHHDVLPLPPVATGKSTSATAQSGQTYPQQVREVRGVVGSDCWDSISVFLGTDVYKRRVLCALSTPMVSTSIGSAVVGMFGGTGSGVYSWLSGSKEVATTSTPNSGIVKKTAEDMVHATGEAKSLFESTVLSLIGDLICALEDEGITAAHIGEGVGVQASKNTTTLKNDGSSGVSFIQYNPPVDLLGGIATLGAAGKVLESLVDPIFVRDLMGSYAQELRYNLEAVGVSLDSFVAKLEKQCARLMTTLKPMYQRSGIRLPSPPVKKPLSSFQLIMPDSQSFLVSSVVAEEASGVGVNLARLMILRARRAYLNQQKASAVDGVMNQLSGETALSELRFVLTHIFRQLRRCSETEARARVLRKTDAVTARITDIENYRLQLLRVLHKRFDSAVSILSSIDNFSSVGKVLPVSLSPGEKDSMALFISRFRIATYEEPPLLDFPACFFGMIPAAQLLSSGDKVPVVMDSRWGNIYITHKDIFFHADAAAMNNVMGLFSKSIASDVVQLVLPISTIAKSKCGPMITTAIASVLGKKRDSAMELRDSAGNIYLFGMPVGSPPHYADRVCDLFTILQSCAFSGHDLNSEFASSVPTDIAVLSASTLSSSALPNATKVNIISSGDNSLSINSDNIIGKESDSLLSSRKDAFSHVMKLASSALDSAIPGKFRNVVSSASSFEASVSIPNADITSESPPCQSDPVAKKKDGLEGDTKGWFHTAPVGSSMSISTTAHLSVTDIRLFTNEPEDANTITADTAAVATSNTTTRVKPASLGKNIQMFLQQQQQQQQKKKI